jgi:hypothetical protein
MAFDTCQQAAWQYGGARIYTQLLFANRLQFQPTINAEQ